MNNVKQGFCVRCEASNISVGGSCNPALMAHRAGILKYGHGDIVIKDGDKRAFVAGLYDAANINGNTLTVVSECIEDETPAGLSAKIRADLPRYV